MDSQTKSVQDTIVYEPVACSNRLLYVARELSNLAKENINCTFLEEKICIAENILSREPYPHTKESLPTLTQCLRDLETINESLYQLEESHSLEPCHTIFIDYVYHALKSEIDKLSM